MSSYFGLFSLGSISGTSENTSTWILLRKTSLSQPINRDLGFPGGSEVKAFACNAGDLGSIPGLGRFPGGGNDNPLQYPCLEYWTEEPGALQSAGSQRVGHNWATALSLFQIEIYKTSPLRQAAAVILQWDSLPSIICVYDLLASF